MFNNTKEFITPEELRINELKTRVERLEKLIVIQQDNITKLTKIAEL